MPSYSDLDLMRARRPLADSSERGDAFCTLGHLEVEQRATPTASRASIIQEITANIAAFDGGGAAAPNTAGRPAHPAAPREAPAYAPTAADQRSGSDPVPPVDLVADMKRRHGVTGSADAPVAGLAASRASMERTLRHQGLVASGAPARKVDVLAGGKTSMQRELQRAGLVARPRA